MNGAIKNMTQSEIDRSLKWYKRSGLTDASYRELMYKINIIQQDYPFTNLINKDGTINKKYLKKDEDLQIIQQMFAEQGNKTSELFKGMTKKQISAYGGEAMQGMSAQEKIDIIDSMNRLKKEFVIMRSLASEELIDLIQGSDIIEDDNAITKVINENRGKTLNQLMRALRNA